MNNIDTISILGVFVSAITYKEALYQIERWIKEKKRRFITVAATHLIIECQRNEKLRYGVNIGGMVTPDGMPLVWICQLSGYYNTRRVYGPDFMVKICELSAQRGWRLFFLGGAPGQSKEVAKALKRLFPGLQISGICDTPVRPIPAEQNTKIAETINRKKPHIVFVGMGCPTQEQWMIDNRKKIHAPVLIGVGAAFDFLSGRMRQAPRWMQRLGFEWLFRFMQEPTRLWKRYTIDNMMFLTFLVRQLVIGGLKKSKT